MTPPSPYAPQDLRDLIQKTLKPLGLYSVDAEELLMATIAQESLLGKFRHQVNGPAIGIAQMEPEDFYDIWKNYLVYHGPLQDSIFALASTQPPRPSEMQDNDAFAIAMCRVHYERAPGELPPAGNLAAIFAYYKQFYNTPEGAATQEQFFEHYKLTGGVAV